MWEELLAPQSGELAVGSGGCKELLDSEWRYYTVRGMISRGRKHQQGCCVERSKL
jgi:hypothetical protein